MAQAEDTELRDLVIDALEKNGSLAKIRALLRANIFLAFEDECDNLKQNDSLAKVLEIPEGKFCLSVIHEFLEFCNLRNTLFVYKSETRQGKEYTYDGVNFIEDKLNMPKFDREKEPILITMMKRCFKSVSKITSNQNDKLIKRQFRTKSYKEQNSTYIVKEDSSTNTSHSQSDNSSDEKNKLDLRLTLDNSDTDTSSDSTRGQSSSEYVPNKHIDTINDKGIENKFIAPEKHELQTKYNYVINNKNISDDCLNNLKINTSSTESTSYAELKPFNMLDRVLLNTPRIPFEEVISDSKKPCSDNSNSSGSKIESLSHQHTIKSTSEPIKDSSIHEYKETVNKSRISDNYDVDVTEYSYDFSSPPNSGKKESSIKQSPRSDKKDLIHSKSNQSGVSNLQNSPSSQSSVSLSDVADLLSDKDSVKNSNSNASNKHKLSNERSISLIKDPIKLPSDDSGDFSESPIQSLSNLSLDIHSD